MLVVKGDSFGKFIKREADVVKKKAIKAMQRPNYLKRFNGHGFA